MNNNTLFDMVEKLSKDTPTVYDCYGCKYNVGLVKDEHCHGCKMSNGNNWVYRGKPTNYEEQVVTFTTNVGGRNR